MKQKKLLKKIWKLLKKINRNTERYEVSGDVTLPHGFEGGPVDLKILNSIKPGFDLKLAEKTVKFRRPQPYKKVTVEATTGQMGDQKVDITPSHAVDAAMYQMGPRREQAVDFQHPHTGEDIVPVVAEDKGPADAAKYEPDHHPV